MSEIYQHHLELNHKNVKSTSAASVSAHKFFVAIRLPHNAFSISGTGKTSCARVIANQAVCQSNQSHCRYLSLALNTWRLLSVNLFSVVVSCSILFYAQAVLEGNIVCYSQNKLVKRRKSHLLEHLQPLILFLDSEPKCEYNFLEG